MEEDDEIQLLPSPRDSSLSPPAPSSLPTSDVTVAVVKKPPVISSQSPSRNALALVVHTPCVTGSGGNKNGRSGGGGGGRDDCWSEEATKVLIEAWGDRFSEPGKGTLKQQHWKEVAEIVNKSRQCKYPKTDIQCKNRIDTVKKKYKQEKAKIASGDGPSKWIFFKKLESLIGVGGGTSTISKSLEKAPMGVLVNSRSNMYKRQAKGNQNLQGGGGDLKRSSDSMRWHFRKRSASETESESDPEPEPSADSAESLPPVQASQPLSFHMPKRLKMDKTGGGVGDVVRAIIGFTEAYEKAETAKLKLMMELEKERMKFAKEMELERMQFLKTQLEITQNNQEEEERSRQRGERRMIDDDDEEDDDEDDDRDVKNNGDLWDETVAGPTPENGLGKLRKHDSLSTVRSPLSSDQVTRSIMVTKGNNNVRGLRKLKMDPGRVPDSPTGLNSNPGTPLTPGTPCDSFGPFTADKIPSSGEADAASLTTYEWIVINALDR
ncbi:Trihelix transcription factor ASIL1 [Cardamine amara subsp. amara]|uniref:Trihelix transcription factor ASIL1 n=1 Tax=Cardamine amara subsp. amara TaxID=228776 RepID=A0ABD1BP12_CARAN